MCLTFQVRSTTLRELHIGWNKIGDNGISLKISEELQQNNSLTILIVRDYGLSVKGKELTMLLLLECTYYNSSESCYVLDFYIALIPYLSYCYDHYRCYYSK